MTTETEATVRAAITAEHWASVAGGIASVRAENGRVYFIGERVAGVRGVPALCVVPGDEPAALTALANAARTDGDSGKLTPHMVTVLRAVATDYLGDPGDLRRLYPAPDGTLDAANALFDIAAAVAALLPPEGA